MKKFFYFLVVNAVIISSGFQNLSAQETTESPTIPSFQLLLSGGLGYANNKEMNDYSKALGDYIANLWNLTEANPARHWSASKDQSGKFVYGADIEGRYYNGNLGFGAGFGIHSASANTEVKSDYWADNANANLNLLVIPLTGTLFYRAIISEKSFFSFGAGLGYYLSVLEIEIKTETGSGKDSDSTDFSSSTLGYHAKIDYNYLIDGICLTGGVMARYVEFDEFKKSGIVLLNTEGKNFNAGLTGVTLYIAAGLAF